MCTIPPLFSGFKIIVYYSNAEKETREEESRRRGTHVWNKHFEYNMSLCLSALVVGKTQCIWGLALVPFLIGRRRQTNPGSPFLSSSIKNGTLGSTAIIDD